MVRNLTVVNPQAQVDQWRHAFGLPVAYRPRVIDGASAERHIKMIRDEFEKEFVPALLEGNLVESYDAAIDLIVYLTGYLSDAGFDFEEGFAEVMGSNMSKLGPDGKAILAVEGDGSGEPAGKVLKGPNYYKPDFERLIKGQLGLRDGEEISV